jgi:hypothetical protein
VDVVGFVGQPVVGRALLGDWAALLVERRSAEVEGVAYVLEIH